MARDMKELAEEYAQSPEHQAMWLLGAAFTEFVKNPSALAWRALTEAMAEYQEINKS